MKRFLSKIGLRYIKFEKWVKEIPKYIYDIGFEEFFLHCLVVIMLILLVGAFSVLIIDIMTGL